MPSDEGFLRAVAIAEGRIALHLVGASVSEDIAKTLAFLGSCALVEPGAGGKHAAMARDEIERLRRLLQGLTRLTLTPPPHAPLHVADALRQVEAALADLVVAKRSRVSLDVPEGMTLRFDPCHLHVLLQGMIEHMLRLCADGSEVEVEASVGDPGGKGSLTVWCEARMPAPSAKIRFVPWTAASEGATGLGLSLAYHVARSAQWELSATQEGAREGLRVRFPISAVTAGPPR